MAERRIRQEDVSATRLSFPLQIVIVLITSMLAGGAAVWGGMSSARSTMAEIQSDVRNIITTMDATTKLQSAAAQAESKLQDERAAALTRDITAIKARQELQQYEIQQLKEAILKGDRK